MKNPRRQAPTVVVEGEPSVALPPLAPLVVEPSVVAPATGEVTPDRGRNQLRPCNTPFMCSRQLIICFAMQELGQ